MNGLILVLATTKQAVARSNRAGRAIETQRLTNGWAFFVYPVVLIQKGEWHTCRDAGETTTPQTKSAMPQVKPYRVRYQLQAS